MIMLDIIFLNQMTDLIISSTNDQPLYELIYATVSRVPCGKVATYGQIAQIVGKCSAQMVGFALAALKNRPEVPWHRVINRLGRISPHGFGYGSAVQREFLLAEGILFDEDDRIDLNEFLWKV